MSSKLTQLLQEMTPQERAETVSLWWGFDNDADDDRLRLREIRRNPKKAPLTILELGAGSGGTAVHCAQAGHTVTAIEISAHRANTMRQDGHVKRTCPS